VYSFFKKIFFSTIVIVLVGIFPFLSWATEYWFELLFTFSLSLINAIVGYYLVLVSINKSDSDFYKTVYGGMLLRMVFVFSLSIYMISNNFVLTAPFMLSLLFFYVIHQWIEIASWLKELPNSKVQLNSQ
jgi:hypothetical protein|tara:strand:- start:1580 stop:1969 length:390 start_codon:yes stop_codon:yes gene_type:complete